MEELLLRLGRLDTCAVSDALDRLGETAGFVLGGFPIRTVPWRISGGVVTVLLGEPRPSQSPRHLCTAAIQASKPGDVLVVAHGGREDCAGWGGTLSYAARAAGVAGSIVDGAIRDVDQSRDLGFAVFARHSTPVTARGRAQEHDWNCEVEIAGRTVCPGAYVVADSSGIAFIARDALEETVDHAETISAVEESMMRSIDGGAPITEVMGLTYEGLVKPR